VFLGRWTALLRALVPAAAGMAKLPYRTFLAWNVAGGLLWASAITLAGYAAGNAYKRLEHYLGRGALAVLAVIVLGAVIRHFVVERRHSAGTTRPQRGADAVSNGHVARRPAPTGSGAGQMSAILAVKVLDPHSLLASFGPLGLGLVLFAETGC